MYLAFIAYHGTVGEEGTERIAQAICQTFTQFGHSHLPYCGPCTDEHTFEKHMTDVIPYSQLFLLVVNDFCPQQNGQIDQRKVDGGAGYLCEEIKSFRNLVKRNTRNVKDFAVYYCGNKRKNYGEIVSYVRNLLRPLDPDDTLYTGNNYYITDLKDLSAWVKTRNRSTETNSIFSDEYAPFEPLEEKVKDLVENKKRGGMLIEMKRGMGKTRFINHVKKDLYPQSAVAIHFTRDQGYVSLGKFRSDFVSQLKEHLGGAEEPVFLDDYGELNRTNFARFLNDFKKSAFPDKTLVVCLDSVDDGKSANGKTSVLDLFGDLSLFDENIVFLFTAKIPEDGGDYSHIMKEFLSAFGGERITVDENNMQYLQFLYLYYSNHILAKFSPVQVKQINPRFLFEAVKPKDMLSFSILFRVVNLYLSTTQEEDPKIIASIEEALKFYYDFLREHSSQTHQYDDFITALIILALSDRPLNKEQLDAVSAQLLCKNVSDAFLKNTSALSILVNTIYSRDKAPLYEIRHEKIKEMIEHDEETFRIRSSLLDNIGFKLGALRSSDLSLLDFVKDNESVIYLFKGYLRYSDDAQQIRDHFETMACRLSHLDWGDKMALISREQDLLSFIVNSEHFENLQPLTQAKYLTRIAIDEMVLHWSFDSRMHFEKALTLWQYIGEENLSDGELYNYFDFLTAYGNCVTRFEDEYKSVQIFEKAVEVSRKLKAKNLIPLRDFTNNLLAYGNVLTIVKQDYDGDKKAIDEARELLENSLDPMDLGQRGWLHQRISYWNECQGNTALARQGLKDAMDAYEYAFTKAPDSFYFGNLIVATGAHLNALSYEKPFEELAEYMREKEENLFIMAKKIDFFSYMEEAIFYRLIGDIYAHYDRKNDALIQYNKALSLLRSAEHDTGVVDSMSKYQALISDKINKLCE